MNHNRLIQIPNTNNDESLQNPLSSSTTIRTMTTVEKNISTNSIPNNDTLLIDHSTSNIDGKHFIPKDYNRFMTSSNLSTNNVINTSEQKSIFHTQLIETL
ncbi:unnamed protein product [Schistosoma turkestanicum]|nr:unnamed protein product [Schistosoma turkestanicum]